MSAMRQQYTKKLLAVIVVINDVMAIELAKRSAHLVNIHHSSNWATEPHFQLSHQTTW